MKNKEPYKYTTTLEEKRVSEAEINITACLHSVNCDGDAVRCTALTPAWGAVGCLGLEVCSWPAGLGLTSWVTLDNLHYLSVPELLHLEEGLTIPTIIF